MQVNTMLLNEFLKEPSSSARLESDRPLGALGLKRHVALRIPFFIPAVLAIAETDLVLTVPRTLAKNDKADNEFADDRTSSRAQAVSLLHELASPPNE